MNYINSKQYLSMALGDDYGTMSRTDAEQHFADCDTAKLIELIFAKYKMLVTLRCTNESATATTYHFAPSPLCNPERLYMRKACEELSLRLGTPCETVPTEDGTIAVRVIRTDREPVYWWSHLADLSSDRNNDNFFVGVDESGSPILTNFDECVHILIGGTTGSGKSVLLKSIICGLGLHPNLYNLAFVDLKGTELTQFEPIASLPVATDPETASQVVRRVRRQMDIRYDLMRNNPEFIEHYKRTFGQDLPKVVLVIDEYAELKMMCPQVETDLIHIAQKGRAAGVHLIIATQRPEYKILSGLLKENLPTKMALHTANSVSSKVLLDTTGAERLIGNGDALLKLPSSVNLTHFQAPYIPETGDVNLAYTIERLTELRQAEDKRATFEGLNYNNLLTLFDSSRVAQETPDPLRALDVESYEKPDPIYPKQAETTHKISIGKRLQGWWKRLNGWQKYTVICSALFVVLCVGGMCGVGA